MRQPRYLVVFSREQAEAWGLTEGNSTGALVGRMLKVKDGAFVAPLTSGQAVAFGIHPGEVFAKFWRFANDTARDERDWSKTVLQRPPQQPQLCFPRDKDGESLSPDVAFAREPISLINGLPTDAFNMPLCWIEAMRDSNAGGANVAKEWRQPTQFRNMRTKVGELQHSRNWCYPPFWFFKVLSEVSGAQTPWR